MAPRPDQELIKALSHPVRVEILEKLQGRIASPVELSLEMERSTGVIAYHASTLLRCGCLELVGSGLHGGGIENFFGITSHTPLRRY
ncbi:MAG TPA: hypothetical protein VF125_00035 [Solirubrobacterales bacterium]